MKKEEFKKVIKNRVAPIALAFGIVGSTAKGVVPVYANEKEGNELNNTEETNLEHEKESGLFSTKEEANKWLEDEKTVLGSEFDIVEEKITEVPNQIISSEKVEVNKSFTREKEALAEKERIEKEDVTNVSLEVAEEKSTEEVFSNVQVNEKFTTEEAKNAFIDSISDKLDLSLSEEKEYTEWTKTEEKEKTLENLTKEERDNKIEELKSLAKANETETVKYEITVEETSKTEKIFVKNEVTRDTKEFNTIEEAREFINNIKKEETEDVTIAVSEPKEKEVFVETKKEEINEEFDSKEELDAYVKEYEDNGYTIKDKNEEIITSESTIKEPNGQIIIKDSHKLDKNSTFSVSGNYIFIKQASGNVAIWTEEELSATEQQNIKNNWLAGSYDGSITSSFNFYYISGLKTFDLSYIGKQWGDYTIVKNGENSYTMTCDAANISHMDYGTFEKGYDEKKIETRKYHLTGSAEKDIYKKIYEVEYNKTEKIYEEKVTYGAKVKLEKLTRLVSYIVKGSYKDKEEKENISYILKGSYEKLQRASLWKAYIKAKVKEKTPDKPEVPELPDKPDVPEVPEEKPEEPKKPETPKEKTDSPQTGDRMNIGLATAGLIASGAAVYVLTKKRVRK